MRTLILLLVMAIPVGAQHKNPFKSWEFWAGTAVEVGAAVFDARTTNNYLRVCRQNFNNVGCWETNPILGRYPSPKRVYITGTAFIAGKRLLIAWAWKKNPKMGRGLNIASATAHTIFHVSYGISNIDNKEDLQRICGSWETGCK